MLNKKTQILSVLCFIVTGFWLHPAAAQLAPHTVLAQLAPLGANTPVVKVPGTSVKSAPPPAAVPAPSIAPAVAGTPAVTNSKPDEPLTVSGVKVDKSAENSVVARNQAIVEARRLAFQKLAERNLTLDEMTNFTPPDDKVIASLVQDFEIKGEQMSAKRYVAQFTVRFRKNVTTYISVKMPEAPVETSLPPEMAATPATPDAPSVTTAVAATDGPRSLLILPYLETFSGKTLLWEDPNPWRASWQSAPPVVPGWNVVVPLGDIADLMTGSSDAVWSGDYKAVEALRVKYGVSEVILAVANKSGVALTIDVYTFKGNRLSEKQSLRPYVSATLADGVAFQRGAQEVMRLLQAPEETAVSPVENISKEIVGGEKTDEKPAVETFDQFLLKPPPAPVVEAPAPPVPETAAVKDETEAETEAASKPPGTELDATMDFEDFTRWMEMQKRLSGLDPPILVDIKRISKRNARFVMKFSGTPEMMREYLTARGVVLTPVAPEEGALPDARALYDVKTVE